LQVDRVTMLYELVDFMKTAWGVKVRPPQHINTHRGGLSARRPRAHHRGR
jgi:hypothetical protein